MSNDHIFASQMWSWADPMIKRDSQGRILVVNAAFLQLYGGTIETWTGNPIDGWPIPKNPGETSRFESRIPLPTGGETVYDWMECTHQDGTAIAMARDVSVYAVAQQQPAEFSAPPVDAEPAVSEHPIAESIDQGAQVQQDLSALSPVHQLQSTPPQQEQAPQPELPIAPAAGVAAAIASGAAVIATQTPVAAAQDTPSLVPSEAPVLETVAPDPIPQPIEPVVDLGVQPDNRAMEKRALPIEDGDAILGNNWRDAVIAKAVGVEEEEITERASADETPATLENSNGDQVKVLLAEDNAINALLTRTLLEAEGCHCDVVEDGALAVEAVKNNEYHLVFMDMRMPNMDGLEATRKIRSLGYNAKILPIVALTANAFDDDRNACFDSGMNDFMTKPVSAEELSAMVKTHTSLDIEKIAS